MSEMEAALWTRDLGKAEEGLYSVGTPGNLGGLEAPVLSPPPPGLSPGGLGTGRSLGDTQG